MFSAFFKHAQVAVETRISSAVDRILLAVPFVVAAGFATAAAATTLTREYGQELGLLIVAACFAVVGLVALVVYSIASRNRAGAAPQITEQSPQTRTVDAEAADAALSGADKELLTSSIAAIAPLALPQLLRVILRNLPLISAVAAAVFVMTRSSSEAGQSGSTDGVADPVSPDYPGRVADEHLGYANAAE